jgi:1,4-dihydroxy-2-naphthoyl-CoA hydrolase
MAWTAETVAEAAAAGFGERLRLRFLRIEQDFVEVEITVGDEHLNDVGRIHGGMLMSVADTLGGVGARLSLRPGWGTATTDSHTNFLAGAKGPLLRAVCRPLRIGERLSVWQTEIYEADRKVSVTSQTQIHLAPR